MILQSLGITHILNVALEIKNYFESDNNFKIDYEKIDMEDTEDFPINSTFEHIYEYMNKVLFGVENTKKIEEFEDIPKKPKASIHHSYELDTTYLGELDTQVLKLDLGSGVITEWCDCEVRKKAIE
jgi:hypothetical protein